MEFLKYQNSIYFLIFLAISGVLLCIPMFKKGGSKKGISVKEAVALVNEQSAVFVDIRSKEEYVKGAIPASRHILLEELSKKIAILPKKPIILIYSNSKDAASAQKTLNDNNVQEVYLLAGGVQAWSTENLPLKFDKS